MREDGFNSTSNQATPIRVVSLIHSLYVGGDETRLLNFSKEYDTTQIEHTVLCLNQPDPELEDTQGSLLQEFEAAGIKIVFLEQEKASGFSRSLKPSRFFSSIKRFISITKKLNQYIRRNRIDVIDARLSTAIFVGTAASRLTNIPLIGTFYSFDPDTSHLHRIALQICFALSYVTITDSDEYCRLLKNFAWWPGSKFINIPNGIERPTATSSKMHVIQRLKLPTNIDMKFVCQVSRIVPYKGLTMHLHAAKRVLSEYSNVHFIFIGRQPDPAHKKELDQLSIQLGIENNVTIASYPGPIGDIWQLATIQGHASALDSLPISIIEGMANGVPCVGTNVGGVPELVLHQRTGLISNVGDAVNFSINLLLLLRDEEKTASMGAAAERRYMENYTTRTMCRELEALFRTSCS